MKVWSPGKGLVKLLTPTVTYTYYIDDTTVTSMVSYRRLQESV